MVTKEQCHIIFPFNVCNLNLMYLFQKNIFLSGKIFSPQARTLILFQCFFHLSPYPAIWRSFAMLSLLASILSPVLPSLGTCSAVWNKFLFWAMLACQCYCLQAGLMFRQLIIRRKVWRPIWGRYFVSTAEPAPALYIYWLLYIYWKSHITNFLLILEEKGWICMFICLTW